LYTIVVLDLKLVHCGTDERMTKMTLNRRRCYALAIALSLASALPAMAQPTTLEGTAWTLVVLKGHPEISGTPTLRFEGGSLTGNDGCNSFRAPYELDGAGVRLTGPLVLTQRACPQPVMAQARSVQLAVGSAAGVRFVGGRLVLVDQAGAEVATYAPQTQDIAGTTWMVTGYNNGKQAVVSVATGTHLTLEFSSDGTVSGTAGCNRFTGSYTAGPSTVSIARVAATRKMCVEPATVMDQETAYLAALTMGTRIRVDGPRLEIRTDDGALTVSGTRTP
jgi:heat shock protein HslJ